MMQKVNINNGLWGVIAGDVVGSIYEFCPAKDYQFPLIEKAMEYTDDSIITIAVADWILSDPHLTRNGLTKKMRFLGNKYPHPMGAYGPMFAQWLSYEGMQAYNSCGNGSAMRVSPVGFAFDTLQETLRVAQVSAEVTHNHPVGDLLLSQTISNGEAPIKDIYLQIPNYQRPYKWSSSKFRGSYYRICYYLSFLESLTPTIQYIISYQTIII